MLEKLRLTDKEIGDCELQSFENQLDVKGYGELCADRQLRKVLHAVCTLALVKSTTTKDKVIIP